MQKEFKVQQHFDENGNRYGKSENCPNKCYWTQEDMVSVCSLYNINMVNGVMQEWCSDDSEC